MQKPELLSPAGNFESLKMAVKAGATAVYFGAKNFNARAKASNFGADLAGAIAYAHMYGVKAYLTLNTLVEQDQISSLCELITSAMQYGIDAFIVQDFGVVAILKNCFPKAVIHASTQMGINNYQGAKYAEQMGVSRVVLSRETSLNDIALIKQNTNLEIEYFVQGALCTCFSGNCYMSSFLFNKSGNKGECMQPCRLPYRAVLKGKTLASGFLLSAKDISMSNRLQDLVSAGVCSFKIEGRLRRESYVYHTTKVYRQIIDNNYNVSQNQQNILKKSFNRGDYCEGYFAGNGNIIDSNIQGHKGLFVGSVIAFEKGNKFNVLTINSTQIKKGDVLKIIDPNNTVQNQVVISAVDVKLANKCSKITTKSVVGAGWHAYIITDSSLELTAQNAEKRLPLNVELFAFGNSPLKVNYSLIYGNGQVLKGESKGQECQSATNAPLSYESAKESFLKLKETNFVLNEFKLNSQNAFVTKKQLNDLRHAMLSQIDQFFMQPKQVEANYSFLKQSNKHFSGKGATIEFGDAFNSSADFYVVKPKDYTLYNYQKITHPNAYLYVPSFLPNQDYVQIERILKDNPNLGVYAQNLGAMTLSNKIILGAKLNLKNYYAIAQLMSKKVQLVELTPELTLENYNKLRQQFDVPFILASFDNFDLMTLVHCPIKTIFKNNCSNCKYCEDINYIMQNGAELKLNRTKIVNCLFTLTKK